MTQEKIECPKCDAEITMDNVNDGECPFCGAQFEIEEESDSKELKETDDTEIESTEIEESKETDDSLSEDKIQELEEIEKEIIIKDRSCLVDIDDFFTKIKEKFPRDAGYTYKNRTRYLSIFKGRKKILSALKSSRNYKIEFFDVKKVISHDDLKEGVYKEKYKFHRLVTKDFSVYEQVIESIIW